MDLIFLSQNWVQILLGSIIWVLFALIFFHLTRGFGKLFFILYSILYVVLFIIDPAISFIVTIIGGVSILVWQRLKSRGKQKFPKAIAKFEAGGIRRGLTPPEITAVFGKPFHKILTLIFIGLLEKGFIAIKDADKLQLKVSASIETRAHSLNAEKRAKIRRDSAQELKQILYPYEEPFLELLEQEDGKAIDEIDFSVTVNSFYKSLAERVGGFDLDQTRDYYRKVERTSLINQDSSNYHGTKLNRQIEWKLLGKYLADETTMEYNGYPHWLSIVGEESEKKQSNIAINAWINNLEKVIQSSLSEENVALHLSRIAQENSSELLEGIIHATYHV